MVLEIGEINKYNKAQAYPSVDITFTGPKRSLVDRVSGNAAQFTRNTIGTYVGADGLIKTAAAGEPRYTYDPLTGEELGLLVETDATNFLYPSTPDYTGGFGSWSNGLAPTVPNAGIAPDGTNTAVRVDWSTVSGAERLYYDTGTPTTVGITEVHSFFVKPVGTGVIFGVTFQGVNWSWINGLTSSKGFYFDFDSETFYANTGTGYGEVITKFPNGWYRISIPAINNGTGLFNTYVQMQRNVQVGDWYIWGVQRENGSYPTSYIPTTTSTITRDPDTVTLTNNNIYNKEKFDIINDPFGVSAGSDTLTLLPSASNSSAIKRATIFSPNIAQSKINAFANKTDEFWRWRVTGDSFGLPTARANGSGVTLDIDWGDGTIENYTAGVISPSHTYTDGKEYHEIGFKLNGDGNFQPSIYNDATHRNKLIAIGPAPESMKIYGSQAFWGCANLIAFDATGNFGIVGSNFNRAWQECTSLKSFPLINTSGVIDFSNAWLGCSGLTSFPLIDTSSGTDFTNTWRNCSSLTSFPEINTSLGENFAQTWQLCTSLTSFPEIDTSLGENFVASWLGCSSLTIFPSIDTSIGINFAQTWQNCTSLTSFPLIDVSSGTSFDYAWQNCSSLTTFPASMFDTTGTLTTTAFNQTFSSCALTSQSIGNILSSLDTNGQSNITLNINGGTNASSYDWGSDAWNGFYNLVSKGWTISYNDNLFSSSPLDLQFAATKTLDSRITFSRSTVGTYVDENGIIQTAAADVPRFDHDPETGESLGLLVEELRTNYIINSTNLYNACFETNGTGSDADGTYVAYVDGSTKGYQGSVAPTGETSVRLKTPINYTIDNGYSKQRTFFNISFPPNTPCMASIFYKNDPTNPITSIKIQGQITTGPTQGTAVTVDLTTSPGVSYGNGWYRLSVNLGTSPSTNGFNFFSLYVFSNLSNNRYCEFAGFQVEKGSFPTSYIPTSGSTVTRAADVASITGTNFSSWYNQSEGTVFADAICNGLGSGGSVSFVGHIHDGTTNNYIDVLRYQPTGNNIVVAGNVSQSGLSSSATIGSYHKSASTYKVNDFALSVDGAAVTTNNSGSLPSPSILTLGNDSSNGRALNGTISRLTYWPKRLPDGALKFITS